MLWRVLEDWDIWAVQYAVALGAEVTVFDITDNKRKAAQDIGAIRYVNVNNPQELGGMKSMFDVIISTIPARYEPKMYVNMLKIDGSEFTHIAISTKVGLGDAVWLDPVTDGEYNSYKK